MENHHHNNAVDCQDQTLFTHHAKPVELVVVGMSVRNNNDDDGDYTDKCGYYPGRQNNTFPLRRRDGE